MKDKTAWPLLYVEWLDHCSRKNNSWETPATIREDVANPTMISSVGWLIHETDSHILLISSKHGEDEVCGDMLIIKGCITRRIVIPVPEET